MSLIANLLDWESYRVNRYNIHFFRRLQYITSLWKEEERSNALTSMHWWAMLFPAKSTSNGDATPDSYAVRSCFMISLLVSWTQNSFTDMSTSEKNGFLELINADTIISTVRPAGTTLQVRSPSERLNAPAEKSCISEIATKRENMYRSPIQVSVVFDGPLYELA